MHSYEEENLADRFQDTVQLSALMKALNGLLFLFSNKAPLKNRRLAEMCH
jgi:hypothetical protein